MILNPPYQAHTVVPRRRGPIFQRRRLWVPSISAFTRVFRRAMRGDDSVDAGIAKRDKERSSLFVDAA